MRTRFGHLVRHSLGDLQLGWNDTLAENPKAKLIGIQYEVNTMTYHLFFSEEVES